MKYVLQIYPGSAIDPASLPAEEQQALISEYLAVGQSPGVIGGHQLQPVETATTVRVSNGEALLTDGPFVDAKEHLGGFFLVEANDLDAALAIAQKIPAARMGGAVEVRPLVER
jgi:hypothetical protein